MSSSKWELFKEKNPGDAVRPWDMLNNKIERVSEDVSKERLDICKQCEHLIKTTVQCKKCGCFMTAKTTLPHAFCPIGKWGTISADNK